jgi:hypothetical protein
MFVKGKEKRTFAKINVESIKVGKYLASISSHQGNGESKTSLLEKCIKKKKIIFKSDS